MVSSSTDLGDSSCRPSWAPWLRSNRAKARKSAAVDSSPAEPDGNTGGTVHSAGLDTGCRVSSPVVKSVM